MAECWTQSWRLELFHKSLSELRTKTIPFLADSQCLRVNLTNKKKEDPLLETVQALRSKLPTADVCVHYSLKQQYAGGADPAYAAFKSFCKELAACGGPVSVLLVSGGGKKKALDTLKVLQRLKQDKTPPPCRIDVCYNPYFPAEQDAKQEQQRLEAKLATGLCSGVWLQMGSDLDRLNRGLDHLHKQLEKHGCDHLPIYGSVFVPTKQLLAQQKFRPWNGVFLSENYLRDVDSAMELTGQLLEVYRQQGVVPLVESSVKDRTALQHVHSMLHI